MSVRSLRLGRGQQGAEDGRSAAQLRSDHDVDLEGMRRLSTDQFSEALARMGPPDGGWLGRHPNLLHTFQEDFRRAITTSDGMSRDNLSWLRDWDFDPASVSIPVQLVYGESDRMAEVAHGEWLLAQLPDSSLSVIAGDHGAIAFGAAEPFFTTLDTERSRSRGTSL